jgi:hypothetical protein
MEGNTFRSIRHSPKYFRTELQLAADLIWTGAGALRKVRTVAKKDSESHIDRKSSYQKEMKLGRFSGQ